MQGNRRGCDALLDTCQGYEPSCHLMGIWPMVACAGRIWASASAGAELVMLPVAVSSDLQACQAREQLYCFPRYLQPRQEPYEPCVRAWLFPPDRRTKTGAFPSLREPALRDADSPPAAIPAVIVTQVKLWAVTHLPAWRFCGTFGSPGRVGCGGDAPPGWKVSIK